MALEPYQERVVAEKAELDERLTRLREFIGGDVFLTVTTDEADRLRRQVIAMAQYSNVLGERIEAWG